MSEVDGNTSIHLVKPMSSYIRSIKPILRYIGTKFIAMPRRTYGKMRRTMSGASSAAPGGAVSDDGTKYIAFRHGRPRKSNMRGVARMQKKLMPINTHLIGSLKSIQQQNSGSALWTVFPIGTPADILDILDKALPVAHYDNVNGIGQQTTANLQGFTNSLPPILGTVDTVVAGLNPPGGVVEVHNPFVDVSTLQNQINQLASRIGIGQISPGVDGRFTVYSHDTYLELKNQITTAVNLVIYECVPRENIMKTTAFNDFTNVLYNGFAKKNICPEGNMPWFNKEASLYMNPIWCHHFNILKARSITLKCGETVKLHMTHGHHKTINPMVLGSELPYLALRNFTRCIVIKQTGTLISNGADSAQVDTSGTSLDCKITTKYRWNAMPNQYEMVTRSLPDGRGWTLGNQVAANPISGFAQAVDEDDDGPDINVRVIA